MYIATAETERYAKSKKQQAFLEKIGLGEAAKKKLYTNPDDYDKNGKEKSLKLLMSRAKRKGVLPHEIVFFDDLQEHVDKARELGIKSYRVKHRKVGRGSYPLGITDSVLEKGLQGKPKVFIFDIDGTLTSEAACARDLFE